jgi:hypothetical protein
VDVAKLVDDYVRPYEDLYQSLENVLFDVEQVVAYAHADFFRECRLLVLEFCLEFMVPPRYEKKDYLILGNYAHET